MSLKILKSGVVVSGAVISLAFSLGCGSDTTGPGTKTAAQLYWQLTLNHHGITLATVSPYDTIQLIATPRTITGDTLTTTARPIFTTSDTSITIDSTGFVRVHGTATRLNIKVAAKLTVGGAAGLTLTDTAILNVVQFTSAASVPVLDSLIFRPVPGDSARRAVIPDTGGIGGGALAPVRQDFTSIVKDVPGNVIPNIAVRFGSSNPQVANFGNPTIGTVTAITPGVVLLTAETTVYGTSRTDSMLYVVGWPLVQQITYGNKLNVSFPTSTLGPPNRFFGVGSRVIGLGGAVVWINQTSGLTDDSLDVIFDDTVGIRGPTVPTMINLEASVLIPFAYPPDPSANIPALGTIQPISFLLPDIVYYETDATNSAVRYFTKSGTYHWHSQRQGISGTIRVVSNDSIK
jgi:hypothetical protein